MKALSLVSQFGKEFLLVKEAILIEVCLLNELQNIIVADIDVQVLIEYSLYFIDAHQALLFPVKQREHVQCLLFSSSSEEPLLGDQINHF